MYSAQCGSNWRRVQNVANARNRIQWAVPATTMFNLCQCRHQTHTTRATPSHTTNKSNFRGLIHRRGYPKTIPVAAAYAGSAKHTGCRLHDALRQISDSCYDRWNLGTHYTLHQQAAHNINICQLQAKHTHSFDIWQTLKHHKRKSRRQNYHSSPFTPRAGDVHHQLFVASCKNFIFNPELDNVRNVLGQMRLSSFFCCCCCWQMHRISVIAHCGSFES